LTGEGARRAEGGECFWADGGERFGRMGRRFFALSVQSVTHLPGSDLNNIFANPDKLNIS